VGKIRTAAYQGDDVLRVCSNGEAHQIQDNGRPNCHLAKMVPWGLNSFVADGLEQNRDPWSLAGNTVQSFDPY